ncbi:heterokaryon incompatibility protein-domain-containing protein [Xylariales sp. AK1849]|nr:heterokaryon incompatibility protein-domain-containing protein [Xylariales sp. AK1849]
MAYSVLESQHIRVLKLEQSDQHDSVLTCSLVAVSLSESAIPQYEALSYVWGDPAERNEILLDGQPTSITRNLWTALKYVRKPGASRTLWIDAICINQDDILERNEQVRQMGRIYSQASRVLIWLGPPDAEIENTMLTLLTPGALEGRQYEEFPKDIALGLQRILSQPWWHRIWVVQEHVLANADPIVGCGSTWLGWKQLSEALLDYSRSKLDESGATITEGPSTWVTDPISIMRHILREQFLELFSTPSG